MIGIDTNLLLRYLLHDDGQQSPAAAKVLERMCTEQQPGFVSLVVTAELAWALNRVFGYERADVADMLELLLSRRELAFQARSEVYFAAQMHRSTAAGFHVVLIGLLARAHGCTQTLTFDRKAAQLPTFRMVS